MNHDTPEAIAITDKAARELLEVEKLKAINALLLEALQEVVRISDRDHSAWIKAKAVISKALGVQA